MSDTAYVSGPPAAPRILLLLVCTHVLLVWLVSPIWLAVLVTAVWMLLFAYAGGSDE